MPVRVVAETPKLTAGPEGFTLQSGDYKLQLRGYSQFDGRFFSGDEGPLAIDTFVLRRVRPVLQGTLGKSFEFLQQRFVPVASTPLDLLLHLLRYFRGE